jgi:iron complex outermembrane receptor protein
MSLIKYSGSRPATRLPGNLRQVLAASVALAALAAPSATLAAEQDEKLQAKPAAESQSRDDTSPLMDDIIVTGTKRAGGELLQKAAVSATALNSEQIDALHAVNISDLGSRAPNVNLRSEGSSTYGTANFFIRGAGVAGSVASDDPAVAVSLDGMTLGVNLGVLMDTFDISDVEILRGPQGTLFGRNATGGAVVIRSARPEEDFSVKLRATIGNFRQREISGSVTGAIVEGLNAKAAVLYKDRDGMYRSLVNGGRQGDRESLVIRPMIQLKPTGSGFDYTIISEFGRIRGDGPTLLAPNPGTFPTGGFTPRRFETAQDYDGYGNLDWWHVIGEGNASLFGGTLTSITTYRKLKVRTGVDSDGLSSLIYHNTSIFRQHQFSQELRWSGKLLDNVDLTTGLYYFDQNFTNFGQNIFSSALAPPLGRNQGGAGEVSHQAFGAFAQADIEVVQGLKLSLGGRYSWEKKDALVATASVDCPVTTDLDAAIDYSLCTYRFDQGKSWSSFTPRVAVSWEAAPNAMLFASYSKGFRSGGFNIRSTNPAVSPGPYEPETVNAFEAGIKLDLADRRVRWNTSVFRNSFSDLQRTVIDSLGRQTVLNAANAKIWGVESELTLALLRSFVLSGSVGYTDASYDRFDGLVGAARPVDQLKLVQVPKWTANITAVYDTQITDNISGKLNTSYTYLSKVAFNDVNTLFQAGYGLLDASASLKFDSSNVEVSIYGRNLTNKRYNVFGYVLGSSTPVFPAAPRTYGVQVSVEF